MESVTKESWGQPLDSAEHNERSSTNELHVILSTLNLGDLGLWQGVD
jgi:hypothetical protein